MEKYNERIKEYFQEYIKFKNILTKKIENAKESNYEDDFSQDLINNNNLSNAFIFFSYIKENFSGNYFEDSIIGSDRYNFLLTFKNYNIKMNEYNLLLYWNHYLIISLIDELITFLIKSNNNNIKYCSFSGINKILSLFKQNNAIIHNLFKKRKINIEQIISLLNIYIFWIRDGHNLVNPKELIYDLFFKLKNYYLYNNYFELATNIFLSEIESNEGKNNLKYLFEHLNKLIGNNQEININKIILLNNTSFSIFLYKLISNLNKEIYIKYSKSFIKFCKRIFYNNYELSNLFEKMIDNMKNSFLNLSLIKDEKNTIFEKDIIIQNFYWEILNELFDDNNENIQFFNYNGIDSSMAFKIQKSILSNTVIIFSFKFLIKDSSNKSESIYPLITYSNDSNKSNISFFIKYKKQFNKYYLYKSEANKKHLSIKDMNFEENKIYYMAFYFEKDNLKIFLNNHQTKIKFNSNYEFDIIQIGYYQKKESYFRGEIGPLLFLKLLLPNNDIDFSSIIQKILNLKENYPNFIYSLNEDTIYKFSHLSRFKYYPKTDREQFDIQIKLKNKSNIKCLLYISPFILKCYTTIKERSLDQYYLPTIPFICEDEQFCNIFALNVSLIESDKIELNFLKNNGLYYICLQYEYFFQLLSILLISKKVIEFDHDINSMINNILNNSLIILSKYSYNILNFYKEYKMIFLNLLNCMKKFCLLNRNNFLDSFIKNFGTLLVGIFIYIEDKRQNSDYNENNENDIKKLIVFRDSLIDLLFTTDFYKNTDIKNIQYIFSLLFSAKKKVSDEIFKTNNNLIWKILSFIPLLEKTINRSCILENNDDKNNRINNYDLGIKNQIFLMIKDYFLCIQSESYHQEKFWQLFFYCYKCYKYKYIIMYYFLQVIQELIKQKYYLRKSEIIILMNYTNELIESYKKTKDINNINNIENEIDIEENKEIKDKLILLIILILIDLIHLISPIKKMNNDLMNLIKSIDISIEKIKSIKNELIQLFIFFFGLNNQEEKIIDINLYINETVQKDLQKVFSWIYSLIFSMLEIINEKCNISKGFKGISLSSLNNEILNIIITLRIIINKEFKKKDKKESIYFIFQQYIEFLNKIAFSQLFNDFTMIELNTFTLNLSETIQICNEEFILNTNILINLKEEDKHYQKTFLEIMIDIIMNILLNNKFLMSHKLTIDCLNEIIFNPNITPKGFTIFYYNDILYNQKKLEKEEKKIIDINNIYGKNNKEKFKMSFLTFALFKLASYYIYQKNNIIKLNDDLNNSLERIINNILNEHLDLYKTFINIFSNTSENELYNKLKQEIENYIISNNKRKNKIKTSNLFSHFKNFFDDNFYTFESVSEEITSGNSNIKQNRNELKINEAINTMEENQQNDNYDKNNEGRKINVSLAVTDSTNENTISINDEKGNIFNLEDGAEKNNGEQNKINNNIIEEMKNIDEKDIKELIIKDYIPEDLYQNINISELTKNTYFLEDIDNYYILNIKKDIMNNVFSLYFIDTFFSNELFKKMKLIYLNNYSEATSDTKSLNFPSKIKKFNNGLEPDNILKLNYKFFYDKYFPVSHPYFYEYLIKNNNIQDRYIKLFHKSINFSQNKNIIKFDCELIKIEKNYFGQLLCFQENEKKGIIIFQENKKSFDAYDESIFDNEEKIKDLFSLSFILQRLKKGKTKSKYKNQIRRFKKIVIIHSSEIDEIVEKRCLLMWQAIEIYLKNGKSYFFNLLSEDKKNLLLNELNKNSNLKKIIHRKEFFSREKMLNKGWKKGLISTYENLLLINKYGSRSFNDSTQYPIFPWILLNNYKNIGELNLINNIEEDNLNENERELLALSLRDFKYPICMQNEEKREDVITKFIEEEGDQFQHHLGIHYSTSSYIYYYLMRQQPCSNLMIKLQNYQLENSNRMFLSISNSISALRSSKDTRELIPELFNQIECLINLNCDFLGIKYNGVIVDDNNILSEDEFFNVNKNTNPFFKFIYFIIEHKKLLNSKIISRRINDWIDNIFGIGQYPISKTIRENCCNIYLESCYEQNMNLKQKYLNKVNEIKKENTQKKKFSLYKVFMVETNLVINFGQVPYQIFKEKYYKRDYSKKKKVLHQNEKDEELNKLGESEEQLNNIHKKNKSYKLKENNYYFYFEINPRIDKIFVLSQDRVIEIINSTLYSKPNLQKEDLIDDLTPLIIKQMPHFLLNERITNKYGSSFLYNMKYAFCSFDIELDQSKRNNPNLIFKTYGRNLIENIKKLKEKTKERADYNSIIYFKFMTCRYIDKTFKIHQLPMKNSLINDEKLFPKTLSYVCEDFVNSCCAVSFCQFLIGLNNGKLIQYYLDETMNIKIERYIKCHHGKINGIEIDKKLGLIITFGDDNYILIRKLYDFELLTPIKIKDKYIITLAKVSPLNFLYVLCYNKQKKEKIIYGYTLNGLKFAKSEYGNYNNFDFTENGNVIALKMLDKLCIFYGSNLDHITIDDRSHDYEVINKIKNAIWLKYNYCLRKKNENYSYYKIITYINDKNNLITIDVSDNNFFN